MLPFVPPTLPLKTLDWQRLVPLLGDAHTELANFNALLRNIPDARLLLAPLAMQEAVLSSRIEGIQATLEDVLRFKADAQASGEKLLDIHEINNYRDAADTAFNSLSNFPLSVRILLDAHATLLSGARGKNKSPGNFRTGTVFIAAPGAPIEQARYIPPEAQNIPQLLSNLEQYIHLKEPDVLVQMAIIHAQFELIHPFWDGNGRLGRLLMALFLYAKEVISAPCFYISEYLDEHRDEYYHRLNAISKHGHWTQWLGFILRATAEQSRRNADKAQAIIDLKESTLTNIQQVTHSQYTPQVTDFIFANPWFTSTQFRAESDVPRPSVQRLLRLLAEGNIITKLIHGKGRRASIFVFPSLLNKLSSPTPQSAEHHESVR